MKRTSNKTILRRLKSGILCCPFCGSRKTYSILEENKNSYFICKFCTNCNSHVGINDTDDEVLINVFDAVEMASPLSVKPHSIKMIREMTKETFYKKNNEKTFKKILL